MTKALKGLFATAQSWQNNMNVYSSNICHVLAITPMYGYISNSFLDYFFNGIHVSPEWGIFEKLIPN